VASGLLFHHFSIGTVSVHQGERVLTIETDRKEIPLTVCYALEDLVNQSVREAKPVSYEVHTQQSAQALDLRRSIKVEGDGVRLVVVEDIDTVACGGLHVANTKEIDLFHYEGQEMIRGHVRLIFTIGAIAREEIRGKERIIEQLGALFSSPVEELVETASKAVTQASSDKSALKKCNERLALLELEKRIAGAPGEKGTPVVLWEVEEGLSLKDIGKAATAFENLALCAVQQNGEQVLWLIALVGKAEFLLDFPKQRQNLLSTIAGKGGGKPPLYQGVGTGEGLILLKTFKDLLV
jgi:alanyl-tRNA synthetase